MHLADIFFRIYSWLRYKLCNQNQHGLHSPFVYNLYSFVIRPDKHYQVFEPIEALRGRVLASKQRIDVVDFGAKASNLPNQTCTRSIASMGLGSAKPARQARLLFGLVLYIRPRSVIELGTSLGLSSAYMSVALGNRYLYTFEGCPNTAALAKLHFQELQLENIKLIQGNIDHTLPAHIAQIEQVDMVFFDANHTKKATISYFETCLAKAHCDTVFIFDDIYWSCEMAEAWQYICDHPASRQTIDIYKLGFVFFKTTQPKQHFVLKWEG